MLLSKAGTKTQDTNKEAKTEAKEVTSVSLPDLLYQWVLQRRARSWCRVLYFSLNIPDRCLRSCSQVQADLKLGLLFPFCLSSLGRGMSYCAWLSVIHI